MTITQVKKLQAEYGYDNWQKLIESGQVWHLEGTAGRTATDLLEMGVCFLPSTRHQDYWHNTIPSRDDLKAGTKGTLENSIRFWNEVKNGKFKLGHDQYFDWM